MPPGLTRVHQIAQRAPDDDEAAVGGRLAPELLERLPRQLRIAERITDLLGS